MDGWMDGWMGNLGRRLGYVVEKYGFAYIKIKFFMKTNLPRFKLTMNI